MSILSTADTLFESQLAARVSRIQRLACQTGAPLAATVGLVLVCSFQTPDVPDHMPLKTLALALATVVLYALHQDIWFWRTTRPLLFGFLPVGLAYHGAFCVAAALLMWTLTRVAWPHHLEKLHHLEESHHREEDSRR